MASSTLPSPPLPSPLQKRREEKTRQEGGRSTATEQLRRWPWRAPRSTLPLARVVEMRRESRSEGAATFSIGTPPFLCSQHGAGSTSTTTAPAGMEGQRPWSGASNVQFLMFMNKN